MDSVVCHIVLRYGGDGSADRSSNAIVYRDCRPYGHLHHSPAFIIAAIPEDVPTPSRYQAQLERMDGTLAMYPIERIGSSDGIGFFRLLHEFSKQMQKEVRVLQSQLLPSFDVVAPGDLVNFEGVEGTNNVSIVLDRTRDRFTVRSKFSDAKLGAPIFNDSTFPAGCLHHFLTLHYSSMQFHRRFGSTTRPSSLYHALFTLPCSP